MEKVTLAGFFALLASTALAQVDAMPEPGQAGAGGAANLCQELLAFMNEPPLDAPTGAPAAASAEPASSSAQAESLQGAEPAEEEGTTPESEAAAGDGSSAPASGQSVPQVPADQTQSAQAAAGQSGPAHGAPDPNLGSNEGGQVENAPLDAGLSAPVPTDGTTEPKFSVLSLAEAEELAQANDIGACQTASRELRLAGVAMPAPLLALTALDRQYHQPAASQPQAPDADAPAAVLPEEEPFEPQTQPLAPQTEIE